MLRTKITKTGNLRVQKFDAGVVSARVLIVFGVEVQHVHNLSSMMKFTKELFNCPNFKLRENALIENILFFDE